jgi:hypothetical protein
MRRFLTATACGIIFLLHSDMTIRADSESCRTALDQYRSAKSDVFDAIKTYASCVRDRDGHDDCSSEFSSLQSEQDDFESAVSDYEGDCG